jgi:hypothetical protein
MTDFQNSAEVAVPALYIGEPDVTIEIGQCGVTSDGAARFSYIVTEGADIKLSGADLCGPASGVWPEAEDMAVTLASFLGSTYECGELTEHGESYRPHERIWLSTVAERMSAWSAEQGH